MGHEEHEKQAQRCLKVAVITFSDTRDEISDTSGRIIIDELEAAGHKIADYAIVREDPAQIIDALKKIFESTQIDALITNGGTGLSSRDGTIEAVRRFFAPEIEGFGEIFRLLSYQQIGAAAMLSRAAAGVVNKKPVFCLPGSSKAVKLAMRRIIIAQLAHTHWEINR